MLSSGVAFVPFPPWYSPTQRPACQLTLNVTKPRLFTQLAAKLFATCSNIGLDKGEMFFTTFLMAYKAKETLATQMVKL